MNAERFPGLMTARLEGRVLADNGGGTQMPGEAIDALGAFATINNAQKGGTFARKLRTDETVAAAHAGFAELLGVAPGTVGFAPNATTAAFSLARCLAHVVQSGDRIVVTDADHSANIAPWTWLRRFGAEIVRVPVDPNGDLDERAFADALAGEPVLVALPWVSNGTGTVFDMPRYAAAAKAAGALVMVDAVQAAPHLRVDVPESVDAMTFSIYKIFGPHMGAWYAAPAFAERFLTSEMDDVPSAARYWSMETGTQNHEGMAALLGTFDYLRDAGLGSMRDAMVRFAAYEAQIAADVYARFAARREHVTLYGRASAERAPVFAFNVNGTTPAEAARRLDRAGIEASVGDYYAVRLMRTIAPETGGAAVRLSFAHYNDADDVERCFAAIDALIGAAA